MRSFIGITIQYESGWTLKKAMLVCKKFKDRHTAENVLSQYEEVLSNYQLGSKISHVTTENASNMIKAFSLPKYEQNLLQAVQQPNH